MTTDVRVEGLPRLRMTLRNAARQILDMSDAHTRAGAWISTRGRSQAPHRTGRLAASVRSTPGRDAVEVTSGLAYANRTHWGYRRVHQAPQPFLYDAVVNGEPVVVDLYMHRVDKVIGSIRGK